MEDFEKTVRPSGFFPNLWLILWRILIAVTVPGIAFGVMYVGFRFLRESQAPAWIITIVAIMATIVMVTTTTVVATLAGAIMVAVITLVATMVTSLTVVATMVITATTVRSWP